MAPARLERGQPGAVRQPEVCKSRGLGAVTTRYYLSFGAPVDL